MAKKIRKNTEALKSYIDETMNEDIRLDQEVQRASGQWSNEMVNELIYTTLTEDYIPPIILGEEEREDGTSQLWCIDGLQRTSNLTLFRYGNYKITSSIRNPIVEYQKICTDENGNKLRDDSGALIKDTIQFDIRNKTYKDLPDELQRVFDSYQIDTVVHQDCDTKDISYLVQRYNNHISLNASQKAFTFAENIAKYIRNISSDYNFFKDCGGYTNTDRKKGTLDRVIAESIMTTNHLDKWKSSPKSIFKFLNDNSNEEEINNIGSLFQELEDISESKYATFFNTKNTCVFIAVYNEFKKLGLPIENFAAFLDGLEDKLANVKCGISIETKKGIHKTWAEIDEQANTKDTKIIKGKIEFLVALMKKFFGITDEDETENTEESLLNFLHMNVNKDIKNEDILAYEEDLEELTLNVDNNSKLLEKENHKSLIGVIAYGYINDITIDDWFVEFFKSHNSYLKDQDMNLKNMINNLNVWFANNVA